jgi:hypothetical protein
MLADFIAAVKSDRKLSFKNWRYRLLHWTFGVNPATAAESPLPEPLYKHYCPLFHLTNLIVLCLPLVIAIKAIRFLFVTTVSALQTAKRIIPSRPVVEPTLEQRRAKQLANIPAFLFWLRKHNKSDLGFENFDHFIWHFSPQLLDLTQDEIRQAWESTAAKFNAAKERNAAQRRLRNEQLAFYVNSSRMIVKGLLYAGYAAAVVAACYAVFAFIIPAMIWIASFLYSVDFLNVLFYVLYFSRNGLVGLLIGFCLFKLIRWSGTSFFSRFGSYILPPYEIASAIASEIVIAAGKSISGVFEFISVFYADNCPSIEIVSTEDEIIEGNT